MERFRSLGFNDIAEGIRQGLKELNPHITPHLYRYQGMGWYDILVEKNGLFLIVSSGGENGWSQEENDKKYAAVTGDTFLSPSVLYGQMEKESWEEVVSTEEFSGGRKQETVRIDPQ